jgi:hypothetical protein
VVYRGVGYSDSEAGLYKCQEEDRSDTSDRITSRRETAAMSATAGDNVTDEDFASHMLAEHLNVILIPKAQGDLQKLRDRTELSRTDIANRAITLYEFVDAQLRAGNELLIRDRETGEIQQVRLV